MITGGDDVEIIGLGEPDKRMYAFAAYSKKLSIPAPIYEGISLALMG